MALVMSGGKIVSMGGACANVGGPPNQMGVNLLRPQYYEAEIPFLNVLKGTNGGNNYGAWDTSGTDHPANLQLDSDGYPTSLTGIDATVYSSIHTAVFVNISNQDAVAGTPPNISSLFPTGPWTFRCTGKFTITLGGDAVSGSLSTSTPGVTVSGLQITSTQTAAAEITFNTQTPTTGGIFLTVSAIPDAVNYPRAMVLVQSSLISSYDAGEIFHPNFIARLQAVGWTRLRFMDWLWTNNRTPQIQFTSTPTSGATSATINAIFSADWSGLTTWPLPTGTYPAIFSDGIIRNCGFTAYSSAVTFSALSATQTNASVYPSLTSWGNRSLPSNMTWTNACGVPVEVCIALCNKLNVDCWFCYPIDADSTYINGVANLMFNGTGTSGGLATSGLSSNLKCYVEFSNEIWNAGFPQQKYANYAGKLAYPASGSQGQEWQGTQVGVIGDAWFSIYGSSAFASRVVVSMGGQSATGNGSAFMIAAMNTPSAGSAAYTHHVGAMHYAPYFDESGNVSAADANAILATGDPALTLLQLAWTNIVGGHTYTVNSAGYIGQQVTVHTTIFAALSGQPWANLPILGYESGDAWKDLTAVTGFKAQLWATYRDSRFQYLYYDPNKTLDGVHTGYLPAMQAVGFQSVNHFLDVQALGSGGYAWGAYESSMQTVTPPKALGMKNYIVGP